MMIRNGNRKNRTVIQRGIRNDVGMMIRNGNRKKWTVIQKWTVIDRNTERCGNDD
jgi:hypothetical protein